MCSRTKQRTGIKEGSALAPRPDTGNWIEGEMRTLFSLSRGARAVLCWAPTDGPCCDFPDVDSGEDRWSMTRSALNDYGAVRNGREVRRLSG